MPKTNLEVRLVEVKSLADTISQAQEEDSVEALPLEGALFKEDALPKEVVLSKKVAWWGEEAIRLQEANTKKRSTLMLYP